MNEPSKDETIRELRGRIDELNWRIHQLEAQNKEIYKTTKEFVDEIMRRLRS